MTTYEFERPPASFLIKDCYTEAWVRPPLLLCGSGNLTLGQDTRDSLIYLISQRNEFNGNMGEVLIPDLYDTPAGKFPDGEIRVKIKPQCTGRHVFILQTPFPDQDKYLMEVFLIADAARRAGAENITTILTYYAYGRKDRKDEPRVPISASTVGNLIRASGIDRVITLDIHADQILGVIPNPWDNLYASTLFIPEVRQSVNPHNAIVMSTDTGGIPRANAYRRRLPAKGIAFVIKQREIDEDSSNPETLLFVGEVEGRDVVIVDDEAVSLNSLLNAAQAAANRGAANIIAVVSHLKYAKQSLDSPRILQNLDGLPEQFKTLLTTDSIELPPEIRDHRLIKVIETAPFWAEVIWRTFFGVQLGPDLID